MSKKLSNTVKIFTLAPIFFIFILAFSACSSADSTPNPLSIELRTDGSGTNIAGGTFLILQEGTRTFSPTLRQGEETIDNAEFDWRIVPNTRDSAQRNLTSVALAPGTDVSNGVVTIGTNQAPGQLRLNVASSHNGLDAEAYVIINIITPHIHINGSLSPSAITVAADATSTAISLSLAEGNLATGVDFGWSVMYADNTPVAQGAVIVNHTGANSRNATITFNRASLTSGELRLNVTAPGTITNNE